MQKNKAHQQIINNMNTIQLNIQWLKTQRLKNTKEIGYSWDIFEKIYTATKEIEMLENQLLSRNY